MSDGKKEQLKKSLSVLGITIGEKKETETTNKGDLSQIISHVEELKKSLSATLSEFDERLEKAESEGAGAPETIQKSLNAISSNLDDKFTAIGNIMKTMYEDTIKKSETVDMLLDSVDIVSSGIAELKQTVDGIADQSQGSRSYTTQDFLEKSFGAGANGAGANDGGSGEVNKISANDRSAILNAFDMAENMIIKSHGEEHAASVVNLAAEYEASGILSPEMVNILESKCKIKFV